MTRQPAIVCPNCGHHILPNVTITDRQESVLKSIRAFHTGLGFSPTYDEIARDLKLSRKVVIRDVDELVRLKRLTRPYRGARNLFLVVEDSAASGPRGRNGNREAISRPRDAASGGAKI